MGKAGGVGGFAHKTLGVAFSAADQATECSIAVPHGLRCHVSGKGGDTSIRAKNWRGTAKFANWLTKRAIG